MPLMCAGRWQTRVAPRGHGAVLVLAWLTFLGILASAVLQVIPLLRPTLDPLANPSLMWSLETMDLPRCSEPQFVSLLRLEVAAALSTSTFKDCQWGIALRGAGRKAVCAAWVTERGHRQVYCDSGPQIEVIPEGGLKPRPKWYALAWEPGEGELVMACDTVPRGTRIPGKVWLCEAVEPTDVDIVAWSSTTAEWNIVESQTDVARDLSILRELLTASLLSGLCLFLGGFAIFTAAGGTTVGLSTSSGMVASEGAPADSEDMSSGL